MTDSEYPTIRMCLCQYLLQFVLRAIVRYNPLASWVLLTSPNLVQTSGACSFGSCKGTEGIFCITRCVPATLRPLSFLRH
jgi:hypothetical protein